jgi:hypothetical protein
MPPCDTCQILAAAETKQSPSGGKILAGVLVVGGVAALIALVVAASRKG